MLHLKYTTPENHDIPQVAEIPSHVGPERKPTWTGVELSPTAKVRGAWVTARAGVLTHRSRGASILGPSQSFRETFVSLTVGRILKLGRAMAKKLVLYTHKCYSELPIKQI